MDFHVMFDEWKFRKSVNKNDGENDDDEINSRIKLFEMKREELTFSYTNNTEIFRHSFRYRQFE